MIYVLGFIIFYVLIIFSFFLGWKKLNYKTCKRYTPSVSVVIALRNEESQVKRLIDNLINLDYPKDLLQYVLINDHSTDETHNLLLENKSENFKILNMSEGEFGKKQAILKGVSLADGDVIITSDADCSFNKNWIKKMVSYYHNKNVKLVAGPVVIENNSGIFHLFQNLEFLSLVGSAAGAIGQKKAIFCNAANMSFKKNIFLELNKYSSKIASGDDVFLLHNIKAKYPHSIVFAKDKEAIVETVGAKNIFQFLNQRNRWTAKSTSYSDVDALLTSIIVFATNVVGLSFMILSIIDVSFLSYLILFFIIKSIIDLLLLIKVLNFFDRKYLIKWVLPFQILYSIYIVFIVIYSFINNFEWKGRKYSK